MRKTRCEIRSGIDCQIKDTPDELGVEIALAGSFRHGGMTHEEIETKLKKAFCELDIDTEPAIETDDQVSTATGDRQ